MYCVACSSLEILPEGTLLCSACSSMATSKFTPKKRSENRVNKSVDKKYGKRIKSLFSPKNASK